jgi:hypothetical protein
LIETYYQGQNIGTVPVVVVEPPRVGQAVVVEIGKTLHYLGQTQKKPAAEYFKKGTGLTRTSRYYGINNNEE